MIVIKLWHVSDNGGVKSDVKNPQKDHALLKIT